MSKNLQHVTNIQEAARELHRRLLGVSWYISCQVISLPPDRTVVHDKQEKREIIVYVRDLAAVTAGGLTTFNSWPVRYELGA